MLSHKVLEAFEHIKLDPPRGSVADGGQPLSPPATMTRETHGEQLSLHTALQGLRPIIETAAERTGVPFQALLSALYTEDVEIKTLKEDS